MDTKEWFEIKRKLLMATIAQSEIKLEDCENVKVSELYRDKEDKTLVWEISVSVRKD